MTKKITIGWVNPTSGNLGVAALAYSVIYLLDQVAKAKNQNLQISIIGNTINKKDKIQIQGKDYPYTSFRFIGIHRIKDIVKLFLSFSYVKNLIKTSFVLDMGEGDSFSDIYGKERFYAINGFKVLFRLMHKKQLLLPQTIGPFIDERIKRMAFKSIEKSKVVLTRDRLSYNYVIANTKQKNIVELIDLAFYLPYTKREIKNNKVNIGLNISALLWHGGYTGDNQFNLQVDYQSTVKAIINYFLSIDNVVLHLVPHVVDGKFSIENDYALSRKILENYERQNIVLAPFFLDPLDAKNYISGLDFFTGARMHACIAAFSSKVPVFPLAYSRKFNGLFEDTLQYSYMGDMKAQTEETILLNLKEAFENRNGLKETIEKAFEQIIEPKYDQLIYQLEKFLE